MPVRQYAHERRPRTESSIAAAHVMMELHCQLRHGRRGSGSGRRQSRQTPSGAWPGWRRSCTACRCCCPPQLLHTLTRTQGQHLFVSSGGPSWPNSETHMHHARSKAQPVPTCWLCPFAGGARRVGRQGGHAGALPSSAAAAAGTATGPAEEGTAVAACRESQLSAARQGRGGSLAEGQLHALPSHSDTRWPRGRVAELTFKPART